MKASVKSMALAGNFRLEYMGAKTIICWLLSMLQSWLRDAVKKMFKMKLTPITTAVVTSLCAESSFINSASYSEAI